MVMCKISQTSTLFVLVWLIRVNVVVLHQLVGCTTSWLTNQSLVIHTIHTHNKICKALRSKIESEVLDGSEPCYVLP